MNKINRNKELTTLILVLLTVAFTLLESAMVINATTFNGNNDASSLVIMKNANQGVALDVAGSQSMRFSVVNITVGANPMSIFYDPLNNYVYVGVESLQGSAYVGYILAISPGGSVIANISGGVSSYSVLDPENGYIYVNEYKGGINRLLGSWYVTAINPEDNSIVASIHMVPMSGAYIEGLGDPVYVAGRLYVPVALMQGGMPIPGYVAVINTATNTDIANITTCAMPFYAVYDPTNGYLYVDCYPVVSNDSISIINTATDSVIGTITLPVKAYPVLPIYNPGNGLIYVYAGFDPLLNKLIVINTTSNTIMQYLPITPGNQQTLIVNIIQAGNSLYISYAQPSQGGYQYYLEVMNESTGSLSNPFMYAQTATEVSSSLLYNTYNGYIYASLGYGDTVMIINPASNSMVANVTVGPAGPESMGFALDPSNGYVYVAVTNSTHISIIIPPTKPGTAGSNPVVNSTTTTTSTKGISISILLIAVVVAVVLIAMIAALIGMRLRRKV